MQLSRFVTATKTCPNDQSIGGQLLRRLVWKHIFQFTVPRHTTPPRQTSCNNQLS